MLIYKYIVINSVGEKRKFLTTVSIFNFRGKYPLFTALK